LHLTHAIQGCVLMAGDRCRVIVNLVHIPRATQIWAQEYDFPASEILDAHRRIGGQVLSEMRHLLEEPSPLPAVLAVAA
jgi:TolB-like protein